ncbi:MAG: serine kinase [Synergistaceae bacterium]|nr:serine kinase [Synergistota bacterium]NLM71226.1 serine kinase [Synergistaceae bacterium]
MKTRDVLETTEAEVFVEGDLDRELKGAISGDLLSFIMAEAQEGWLWITIHTHINAAAVAVLKEVPFILATSGRTPDKALTERCATEGITLAVTGFSSYDAAGVLWEAGLKRPS